MDEKCNARKCTMWNHRSWGLRKQKQVGSLTPRIVSPSDLALPTDTGLLGVVDDGHDPFRPQAPEDQPQHAALQEARDTGAERGGTVCGPRQDLAEPEVSRSGRAGRGRFCTVPRLTLLALPGTGSTLGSATTSRSSKRTKHFLSISLNFYSEPELGEKAEVVRVPGTRRPGRAVVRGPASQCRLQSEVGPWWFVQSSLPKEALELVECVQALPLEIYSGFFLSQGACNCPFAPSNWPSSLHPVGIWRSREASRCEGRVLPRGGRARKRKRPQAGAARRRRLPGGSRRGVAVARHVRLD